MPKKTSQSGSFMVEALMSLALIAIVTTLIVMTFFTLARVWKTGVGSLLFFRNTYMMPSQLDRELKKARDLMGVSLSDNPEGYIQYHDENGQMVTLYLNSNSNQQAFGQNAFPTTNLVMCYSNGTATSNPDLLLDQVQQFFVSTYTQSSSLTFATPNNSVTQNTYDQVTSVKFQISQNVAGKSVDYISFLTLNRSPLQSSGALFYGDEVSQDHFPFQAFLGYDGFQLTGMTADLDGSLAVKADGITLTTPNFLVKLRNTGRYFSSIQAAISAAASGNEILVSGGTFREALTLKPGIRVVGGYDPLTWARDPNAVTTVVNPGGINASAIAMADQSQLENLTINGNGLSFGILASNVTGAVIRHCRCLNADYGISFSTASGQVWNTAVTADITALFVKNTTDLSVLRNRLASNGSDYTVFFDEGVGVNFRNNLVINGGVAMNAEGLTATVVNNLFTGGQSLGFQSDDQCNLTLKHNSFYANNFGLFIADNVSVVEFNHFSDNVFGNSATDLSNSNLQDSDPGFSDTQTFRLSGSSNLIDAGQNIGTFHDVSIGGLPSLGTVRNDIGAYGGPFAGRIGPGIAAALSSNDNLEDRVNAALPGDWFVLGNGSYSLNQTVTFKKNMALYGQGADRTDVLVSVSPGLSLSDDTTLEDFGMEATGGQTMIGVSSRSGVVLRGLLLQKANPGVDISASSVLIKNLSCTENQTAVRISGGASDVSVFNSIFASSTLSGVTIQAGTVRFFYNDFFNNTTHLSGVPALVIGSLTVDPQFWDPSQALYFLQSTSPMINANNDGQTDLGAFEYYVVTGQLLSPVISSTTPRAYKTLSMTLFGDAGVPTPDPKLSQIEAAIVMGNAVATQSLLTVSSTSKQLKTWELGPRIVGSSIQVRVAVRGYRYGASPYINQLKLTWLR